MHAVDIFRAGFNAHQNGRFAILGEALDFLGRQGNNAGSCARRRGQTLGKDGFFRIGIKGRVQQLVKRRRIDAQDSLFLANQPLFRHVDGDLERCRCGALAATGLQHEQLAALHRELDILHIAVMLLEVLTHLTELLEHLRHHLFHGWQVGILFLAAPYGQVLRGTDTGNHVLALCIDEVFAIKLVLAGGRVAGEGNAGGAIIPHIAEHHGLNIDRSAPCFRDIMQAAIGFGPWGIPGLEHGLHRAHQLLLHILREWLAEIAFHHLLVFRQQFLPVISGQFGVEIVIPVTLQAVEQVLELIMINAEHHVGIHGDEAAVAVIGETGIARPLGQPLNRHIVQTEVQNRIHHAGHGDTGTGADRHQQRVVAVAELGINQRLDLGQRLGHLRFKFRRQVFVIVVIIGAAIGWDREARRHRQTKGRHLRQIGTLATQQVLHRGGAIGLAITEGINPFARLTGLGCRVRSSRCDRTHGLIIPQFSRNRRFDDRSWNRPPAGPDGSPGLSHPPH